MVLKHDNPFLLASFGLILVGMALYVLVSGEAPGGRGRPGSPVDPRSAAIALGYAVGVALLLWIPAVIRIQRIRDVFACGTEVQATVRKVRTVKGYSRIDLDFVHNGAKRSVRRTIRGSAKASALEPGSAVGVLVDPQSSRRVVLAELFDESTQGVDFRLAGGEPAGREARWPAASSAGAPGGREYGCQDRMRIQSSTGRKSCVRQREGSGTTPGSVQ
jgi:hypothetical protein